MREYEPDLNEYEKYKKQNKLYTVLETGTTVFCTIGLFKKFILV